MDSSFHTAPRNLELSALVRKWCEILGCSQNALARKAKVDPSVLCRLILGKATAGPSLRRFMRFVERQEAKLSLRATTIHRDAADDAIFAAAKAGEEHARGDAA